MKTSILASINTIHFKAYSIICEPQDDDDRFTFTVLDHRSRVAVGIAGNIPGEMLYEIQQYLLKSIINGRQIDGQYVACKLN